MKTVLGTYLITKTSKKYLLKVGVLKNFVKRIFSRWDILHPASWALLLHSSRLKQQVFNFFCWDSISLCLLEMTGWHMRARRCICIKLPLHGLSHWGASQPFLLHSAGNVRELMTPCALTGVSDLSWHHVKSDRNSLKTRRESQRARLCIVSSFLYYKEGY